MIRMEEFVAERIVLEGYKGFGDSQCNFALKLWCVKNTEQVEA